MIEEIKTVEPYEVEEDEIDMELYPDDDYFTFDDETGEEVY